MTCFELLAQATQPGGGAGQAPPKPGGYWTLIGYAAIVFFIFWFIVFRPRKQEQKQREHMMGNLKKYDKVMTIGGVIGTVMEVRDDEVILKVDDNTNTRIKFTRGAIQKIITPSEGEKDLK